MATNKGRMLNLNADFSEALASLGMMQGMSQEIRTVGYTGAVLGMVHARLAELFDVHVDAIAQSETVTGPTTGRSYSPLHHVYEWNQVGEIGGRLWKHIMQGQGASRTASFEFKASKKAVPHPYHNQGRDHVFYWKAVIMEYSIPVFVKPKNAQKLSWFMNGKWNFSTGVQIDNPGGETAGQFTNVWVYWWNNVAPVEFERLLKGPIEQDLKASGEGVLKKMKTKTVTLSTISNADKAFELGRKMAQDRIREDADSYSNVSKEIFRGLND